MPTAISVSVEIRSEAEARIAELGLENEVQTMIEHTLHTMHDLHSIEVTRYDDAYEAVESRIVVTAWLREQSGNVISLDENALWDEWIRWYGRPFPGRVRSYIGFDVYLRDHYAR